MRRQSTKGSGIRSPKIDKDRGGRGGNMFHVRRHQGPINVELDFRGVPDELVLVKAAVRAGDGSRGALAVRHRRIVGHFERRRRLSLILEINFRLAVIDEVEYIEDCA